MLPPEERERLLKLQSTQLKRRVSSLRQKGWTVRDIATALDRAPSTIQYWSQHAPLLDDSDVPAPPIPTGTVVMRRHVEVSPEVIDHLRSLTDAARRVNRHTQVGLADAKASQELTYHLTVLVKQKMIPVVYLAKALDISPSAVSQRVKEGAESWKQSSTPSSGVNPQED